jgi:hypothetical protein
MSSQQPTAAQHFKSATESTMSVTTQMAKLAITRMRDEASTTKKKWQTLEAWKTVLCHCHNLDDELGFTMNLTMAVQVFGSIVDSRVSGGNSGGVHFWTQHIIKHCKAVD